MDFAFTPDEDAFRAELRAFLADELPDWWRGMFVDDERTMPLTREICRKLADRGWLTMAWPEEHGGQGASVWMQTVLREEMWAHEEPRGPQYMNLNYIGPLIMRFGSPDQRAEFLPLMAHGEVIFTQLFSEPDAGSDLASLQTKARDEGDHFVVNGQKIWSSYADAPADWGLLLARTNRRRAQARGHQRVPARHDDAGRDGSADPDHGRPARVQRGVPRRRRWCRASSSSACRTGLGRDHHRPHVRAHRHRALRARAPRVLELAVEHVNADRRSRATRPCAGCSPISARGSKPHASATTARSPSRHAARCPRSRRRSRGMHNTTVEQLTGNVVMEVLGATAQLRADDADAPLDGEATRHWLRNIPTTVAAGTLEIQKNIVAQRGLGLPRPT